MIRIEQDGEYSTLTAPRNFFPLVCMLLENLTDEDLDKWINDHYPITKDSIHEIRNEIRRNFFD